MLKFLTESLSSPTSINNIGFKRQKRIEDSNISSDALCVDRCNYELKKLVSLQNEVSISCIPFLYFLDIDNIITITGQKYGFQ